MHSIPAQIKSYAPGFGAFARIRYGRRNVTLNGSMNYLRPTTRSKTLTAVGREIKVGGHVGFFEVNIACLGSPPRPPARRPCSGRRCAHPIP